MLSRQFESDEGGAGVEEKWEPTAHPVVGTPQTASPWHDLDAFNAAPRIGGLTLSPDGSRLVVSVTRLSHDQTAFVSALWSVDMHGEQPARRLTRSVEGDTAGAFLRDGSLLFTSRRALPKDGDDKETVKALWCLPAQGGEAYALARRDGGWGEVLTCSGSDQVVFAAPMFIDAPDAEADTNKRAQRSKKKIAALLHDGFPVRNWDHDITAEAPRLFGAQLGAADGACLHREAISPIGGSCGRALRSLNLSPAGDYLAATWAHGEAQGFLTTSIMRIETATGERRVLVAGAPDCSEQYSAAAISADGALIAGIRFRGATSAQASEMELVLVDATTGACRDLAPDWDRRPSPVAFSPDGGTLYCTAMEDGAEPLFAVDIATGGVHRLTADICAYSSTHLSPDGSTLYSVRHSYTNPGEVVAIDTATGDVTVLDCGVVYPELPGTLERVETITDDGVRIPGYLALPHRCDATNPAPFALWVHGGPLSSWCTWSWRWCPWQMVSRGYAVLLPDPALSVGYGQEFIQRGWGRWGAEPYTDLIAITDAIVARADIDESVQIAMGGSFGGYMMNWMAGHTDRFKVIVTHAALWNLTSFCPTTDGAWYWDAELSPEMTDKYSPHQFVERITTPMLVIHGDNDYRVPIGEGLALWWLLNKNWKKDPKDLPHRFLYYPNENHWVLTPQHAKLWYETVFAFLDWHVLGHQFAKPELL